MLFRSAGDTACERGWGKFISELCAAVAQAWDIWSAPFGGERLSDMLSLPSVSRFILIHEDKGVLWFNKERFESLCAWLAAYSCMENAVETSSCRFPAVELVSLASASGYRVRGLLNLAEDIF